jgi:hypothetical protein
LFLKVEAFVNLGGVLKDEEKEGGIRIIYYYKNLEGQVWFLTVYAKNEAENISLEILKKIRERLEE